jgi:hypothetical protein
MATVAQFLALDLNALVAECQSIAEVELVKATLQELSDKLDKRYLQLSSLSSAGIPVVEVISKTLVTLA